MIPKLVAQGLINSGYPRAGLAVLSEMLASTPHDHPDQLDGLGLAGRANKQVYVDCGAPPRADPSARRHSEVRGLLRGRLPCSAQAASSPVRAVVLSCDQSDRRDE